MKSFIRVSVHISVFILMIFIGISVFGFWNMGHMASASHDGCIASTVTGVACPDEVNALSFLSFHVDAFLNFFTALVSTSFITLLLFVIATVPILIARLYRRFFIQPFLRAHGARCVYFLKQFSIQPLYAVLYWMALHEHSPSFS